MKIGIVGNEAAKFTPETERAAKKLITEILMMPGVTEVVSGGCHLGGIDVWAVQIGRKLGLKATEFLPKNRSWSAGYKRRNIQIARHSDEVHNIVVDKLPEGYSGMVFPRCYHCHTSEHVKSGGCWTAKFAQQIGKPAFWHVIDGGQHGD